MMSASNTSKEDSSQINHEQIASYDKNTLSDLPSKADISHTDPRNAERGERSSSTSSCPQHPEKQTGSLARSLSTTAERISPLFKRSNSITIPFVCVSQSENDVYSKSVPCFSNESQHHNGYGSISIVGENNTSQENDSDEGAAPVNNDSNEPCAGPEEKLYFGYNKKQLKVFFSLVLLSLNDIMGYSAIAPFYPVVAESKGLSPSQVGIIFSIYSVFAIFASILTGIVLVRVGAKFCVLAGMFWNAGSLICFGFLNQMSATPFFVLSLLARGLMGFGSSTAYTAMFAIVFQEFNERAITVLSLSEALVGVGGMVGPLIGGGLYQVGGYMTPFLALGGVQVILFTSNFHLIPSVPVEKKTASVSPFHLLRHSSAFVAALVVVVVSSVFSFITANISPFLADEFNMNAVMVGVVFLVNSVFYAGMSPIWGYVADKWPNSYLTEVGLLGIAVGMALYGPVSFFLQLFNWTHQHLWLLYVATIINGTFVGASIMPTFNEMQLAASELDLKDSMLAKYGLVSGLFMTSFSLGDIAGPTLGGLLADQLTFQNAAGVFSALCLFLLLLRLLQRYYRHVTKEKRAVTVVVASDETTPLLNDRTDIQ